MKFLDVKTDFAFKKASSPYVTQLLEELCSEIREFVAPIPVFHVVLYKPKASYGLAFSIANEANLSAEELELQHKKRDWIYIQKSSIGLATKTGLKQGLEEGLEQGLEKGLEQGEWNAKVTMIINAHQLGLPMQTISELTGVDEDKILSAVQNRS